VELGREEGEFVQACWVAGINVAWSVNIYFNCAE